MKISAVCTSCDRDFLAEQTLESGGRCPWCGVSFQSDYAAVLTDALRDAERAGTLLESSLEKLAELRPGFRLARDSVMGRIGDEIDQLS